MKVLPYKDIAIPLSPCADGMPVLQDKLAEDIELGIEDQKNAASFTFVELRWVYSLHIERLILVGYEQSSVRIISFRSYNERMPISSDVYKGSNLDELSVRHCGAK